MHPVTRGVVHSTQRRHSVPGIRACVRHQQVPVQQPLGERVDLRRDEQGREVLDVDAFGGILLTEGQCQTADVSLEDT